MKTRIKDSLENLHPLLTVNNLNISFKDNNDKIDIIKNVTFSVMKGETVALIGGSGSGKSLTSSCILGAFDRSPSVIKSGKIIFNGRDILNLSSKQRQEINGKELGMVFQDPLASFNPVLSIGFQISETFRLHGVPKKTARKSAEELMRSVGIEDACNRYRYYPHQFSGGQRQRLLIAMAIAMKPDLLIADEPTSSLDATVKAQIIALLKNIQTVHGMGMLFITHDINLARSIADRILVMHNGKIVEDGSVEDVFNNPVSSYTKHLLSCVPKKNVLIEDEMKSKPVLEINNVFKSYRLKPSLSTLFKNEYLPSLIDASLTVNENEIVCVVGGSGSGKSTLVRTILGLESQDSGSISLYGRQIRKQNKEDLNYLRNHVQTVFQDPSASMNPLMKVSDIISEAFLAKKSNYSSADVTNVVCELLNDVGLSTDYAERYPHQLSGGQIQRIAIARAIASKPRVLIADEAVSALDASVQFKIINLLNNIKEKAKISILFVTHDIALVRQFADYVIVMSSGKIIEEGSAYSIFNHPKEEITKDLLRDSLS